VQKGSILVRAFDSDQPGWRRAGFSTVGSPKVERNWAWLDRFTMHEVRTCIKDPRPASGGHIGRDALLELTARQARENEAEPFVDAAAAERPTRRFGAAGEVGS
jgi:hypothetical protein